MLLYNKPIKISKHCYERFLTRVLQEEISNLTKEDKREVRKAIISDLQIRNLKYKSLKDKKGYIKIFTKNSRSYIIVDKGSHISVVTVIQQDRKKGKKFKKTIDKGLRLV